MSALQNPRKWRYTWETLDHIPTLRLFLFSPKTRPSNQCKNLKVSLNFEESLLLVSWIEEIDDRHNGPVDFFLRVPVPRVLVDVGSPVDFRATEDHIAVKLVLLLPVDHPLALNFDSVLNLSDESYSREHASSDGLQPLSIDSDLSWLSSGEGVHFYCKICSVKLTRKPLRSFVEMPSVNWREVADNWFGSCCCSFGGISEKLVTEYANSYICAEGTCLLDATSVIVSKDDLAGYVFPVCLDGNEKHDSGPDLVGEDNSTEATRDSIHNARQGLCCANQSERTSDANESCMPLNKERSAANLESEVFKRQNNIDTSFCMSPSMSDFSENVAPVHGPSAKDQIHCCVDKTNYVPSHDHEHCSHGISTSSTDQKSKKSIDLLKIQKSLLNGSLGNGFIIKTSSLSKDVEWVEFLCTQCSSLLGAYPSISDGHAPLDGGVRLFKCYIATGLPLGGSGDLFRKQTLQRMFANQLMESATDELSFRTVVRDLGTKSPMLQIVLLNPNAWCSTGYCFETEGTLGSVSKIDLHPVVKVVFSDCSNATVAQSRMIEEWATKNQADEVFMLTHQIEELIESLKSAQDRLPISCSFMQGLYLSFMER